MFKKRLSITGLFAALCLAASPVLAGGEGWTDDFPGAQKTAEADGKDLLLEFTGSDWCPPCMELAKNVFSHDSFTEGAGEHFVLVELDFPNKPQAEELKKQNRELQEKYGIRGYPTVILADAQGRPYAQTGYRPGGPEEYMAHLEELRGVRVERDEHFKAAESAEGLEKAKHLFEAMKALGDEMALKHYKEIVDEIVAADADNDAGIKKYYDDIEVAKKQMEAVEKLMQSARNDPEGTITKLEEVLADEATLTSVKQETLAYKSQIQKFILEDDEAAKATLIEAIEVDPDSETGKLLKDALERFFGDGA